MSDSCTQRGLLVLDDLKNRVFLLNPTHPSSFLLPARSKMLARAESPATVMHAGGRLVVRRLSTASRLAAGLPFTAKCGGVEHSDALYPCSVLPRISNSLLLHCSTFRWCPSLCD